jgi:hypothetical protein
MTTHVKKGAGRPAATARTARHAQRTMLPPKQQTADPDVILHLTERATKSKSIPKAKAFCDKAESCGWVADRAWAEGGEDHIVVTARRDAEVVFIEWMGGVFQPTATYSHGDRTIRVRNASAALQYAGRPAEQAAEETKKVSANRFFQRKATPAAEIDAQRQTLPFDPALALDDEIFGALAGQRITWFNRTAQSSDTAIFPIEYRREFTHITEFNGERIVNFVDHGGTGFRSFRLSDLLSVSRGKSQSVKKSEQIAKRQAAGFAK